MPDTFQSSISTWFSSLKTWWLENLTHYTRDDYDPFLDVGGFLGILAFSVAVFTLSSPKFQIRQATAMVPFRPVFFGTLVLAGIIMFVIEGLILYGIRIPSFMNPNTINYLITTVIALLILYWMKICFIIPPRFSRFTAHRFFRQTYFYIANGGREEMLALARELMREAPRLIRHTPRTKRHHLDGKKPLKFSKLQTEAHFLNGLLSDTRFCEVIAEEIPSFPAHMVEVAVDLERLDVPIHLMVKRTVVAMLSKPGSALRVENEWLDQGYIGEAKPITRSLFWNWHLLEGHELGFESPLDLDYPYARDWDKDTWRTYFGMARLYVDGLTSKGRANWHALGIRYILNTTEKAFENIGSEEKYSDVFSSHNPTSIANEANDFLKDLVKAFDKGNGWVGFNRSDDFRYGSDLSSDLASLYFKVIFKAAQINTKEFRMWHVQHNTVWSPIYSHEAKDTKLMKMVRRKLRRMIWDEVLRMDEYGPNYKGAGYTRFCLNVLGFYDEKMHRKDPLERDLWPLAKVLSNWVKKNYQTIAASHPPVAKAMLPANIEYDPVSQILVRSRDDTLTGVPRLKAFPIDPARPNSDS
ncbi:MAG: hypothetical protein ABJZ56_03475 [Paracoccaceae bacterium]